jgi:hypothetical protein
VADEDGIVDVVGVTGMVQPCLSFPVWAVPVPGLVPGPQLTLGPGVTSFVVTLLPFPLFAPQPLNPATSNAAVTTNRLT